ncbi:phospholipase D-like domain-containing protein [Haladaptatus sp. YSMS36]|uniref:phospholipase D-like domain-containing protein n=1 Tax=Haladaptatus sp. YSMS36 TaxID=3033384 RepID=UPI0023E7BED5|nr:phospholipase D-like domain-containing protein [Haladaptatus sp. YSMS36]
MVRAFSLPSNGLRYFIGFTLARADHVAICSPWLSDVDIRLPLLPGVENRSLKLASAIDKLGTDVDFYIKSEEDHNEYAISKLKNIATIVEVDDLHAKAIVTDEFVYMGSANITQGGLHTNIELCEVLENEFDDVTEYIDARLDFSPVRH